MPEHKQVFRKMNLDADPMALGKDEYTYLKNGVPMQSVDGHDWSVGHVLGNNELVNADLPAGTNTIVMECEDIPGGRIFYGIHNSNNNHTIYQLTSALVFTRVIRTSLLGFVLGAFHDADIVDNVLIWTNNTGEIKKINVAKAIAGGTYTPTAEELTLIKRPPQLVLTGSTLEDLGFSGNYVYEHYFQFYYKYVYEDDDESVYSNISDVIRPQPINNEHNAIDVTIPAAESIPATVKRIDYAVRVDAANEFRIYRSDFPVGGVLGSKTHRFYNDTLLETVPDIEALKWFDSVPLSCKSLRIFKNRPYLFNNTEGYDYKASAIANFTVTPASGTVEGRTFKNRGQYDVAIMFFDFAGRHAGAHKGATAVIPDRTDADDPPRWTLTINIASVAQADIPLWATHYAIVRTKVKNFSFFLQHKSADMIPAKKAEDGTYEWFPAGGSDNWEYLAIDIGSLTKVDMGYIFQPGDRIRIYWDDPVFTISDVEIKFQDGKFLFVNWEDSIENGIPGSVGSSSQNFNFEIYRVKTDDLNQFYEVGQKFAINNPGTGSRAFSSTAFSIFGDCESFTRVTYKYAASGYDATDPYGNTLEPTGSTDIFQKVNAFDKNPVWAAEPATRPQPFSRVGSKEIRAENSIRFGHEYIKGSQVSNLNTFDELDEYLLPSENGPGVKLQDADDVLTAICQNENTALYIGEAFVNTADGNQFLAKTDRVIGDDRKYFGGFGSIHPESVEEYSGRVYYYDMTKGAIIRRSNDGLTIISNYGVSNFAKKFSRDNYANRATMRFPGGYDPVHDLYILSAISSVGTVLWTIGFHEPSNSWVGFFDYLPQLYSKINGFLISFNAGKTYLHNNSAAYMNFYGVQKQREIEFAVAINGWHVSVWHGFNIDGDEFYVDSGSNDTVVDITNDGTGVITSGTGGQHTTITFNELIRREDVWRSAIFRDLNTPQPYDPAIRAKFEGNPMRGQIIRVKIVANKTNTVARLRSVGLLYRVSQLS